MELALAEHLWRLAGVLALVFANGFFVAAEFSIVTVRKTRIDQLIAEGQPAGARRAPGRDRSRQLHRRDPARHHHGEHRPRLDRRAGAGVADRAGARRSCPRTIAATTAHTIAVAIAFAIITALHIVLGELAPKTIALERPEATALWVVKPTELFMKAFWPFIRLLNGTGRAVVNLLGLRSRGGHAMVHSEEELKMLVTASQEAGVLEEREEQMLHRVFGFADLTAGQVMVPRTELVAIADDLSGDLMIDQIARAGYPTLPVYRDDLDNVVGILHVTDVIQALAAGERDKSAGALAREALTVPETLAPTICWSALRRRRVREAHRDRRVRRHGRPGHLRIADGAHRRRRRRSGGQHGRHRRAAGWRGRDRRPHAGQRRQRAVRSGHRRGDLHDDRRLRPRPPRPPAARRRHHRGRRAASCGWSRSTGCAWRRCGCRHPPTRRLPTTAGRTPTSGIRA